MPITPHSGQTQCVSTNREAFFSRTPMTSPLRQTMPQKTQTRHLATVAAAHTVASLARSQCTLCFSSGERRKKGVDGGPWEAQQRQSHWGNFLRRNLTECVSPREFGSTSSEFWRPSKVSIEAFIYLFIYSYHLHVVLNTFQIKQDTLLKKFGASEIKVNVFQIVMISLQVNTDSPRWLQ